MASRLFRACRRPRGTVVGVFSAFLLLIVLGVTMCHGSDPLQVSGSDTVRHRRPGEGNASVAVIANASAVLLSNCSFDAVYIDPATVPTTGTDASSGTSVRRITLLDTNVAGTLTVSCNSNSPTKGSDGRAAAATTCVHLRLQNSTFGAVVVHGGCVFAAASASSAVASGGDLEDVGILLEHSIVYDFAHFSYATFRGPRSALRIRDTRWPSNRLSAGHRALHAHHLTVSGGATVAFIGNDILAVSSFRRWSDGYSYWPDARAIEVHSSNFDGGAVLNISENRLRRWRGTDSLPANSLGIFVLPSVSIGERAALWIADNRIDIQVGAVYNWAYNVSATVTHDTASLHIALPTAEPTIASALIAPTVTGSSSSNNATTTIVSSFALRLDLLGVTVTGHLRLYIPAQATLPRDHLILPLATSDGGTTQHFAPSNSQRFATFVGLTNISAHTGFILRWQPLYSLRIRNLLCGLGTTADPTTMTTASISVLWADQSRRFHDDEDAQEATPSLHIDNYRGEFLSVYAPVVRGYSAFVGVVRCITTSMAIRITAVEYFAVVNVTENTSPNGIMIHQTGFTHHSNALITRNTMTDDATVYGRVRIRLLDLIFNESATLHIDGNVLRASSTLPNPGGGSHPPTHIVYADRISFLRHSTFCVSNNTLLPRSGTVVHFATGITIEAGVRFSNSAVRLVGNSLDVRSDQLALDFRATMVDGASFAFVPLSNTSTVVGSVNVLPATPVVADDGGGSPSPYNITFVLPGAILGSLSVALDKHVTLVGGALDPPPGFRVSGAMDINMGRPTPISVRGGVFTSLTVRFATTLPEGAGGVEGNLPAVQFWDCTFDTLTLILAPGHETFAGAIVVRNSTITGTLMLRNAHLVGSNTLVDLSKNRVVRTIRIHLVKVSDGATILVAGNSVGIDAQDRSRRNLWLSGTHMFDGGRILLSQNTVQTGTATVHWSDGWYFIGPTFGVLVESTTIDGNAAAATTSAALIIANNTIAPPRTSYPTGESFQVTGLRVSSSTLVNGTGVLVVAHNSVAAMGPSTRAENGFESFSYVLQPTLPAPANATTRNNTAVVVFGATTVPPVGVGQQVGAGVTVLPAGINGSNSPSAVADVWAKAEATVATIGQWTPAVDWTPAPVDAAALVPVSGLHCGAFFNPLDRPDGPVERQRTPTATQSRTSLSTTVTAPTGTRTASKLPVRHIDTRTPTQTAVPPPPPPPQTAASRSRTLSLPLVEPSATKTKTPAMAWLPPVDSAAAAPRTAPERLRESTDVRRVTAAAYGSVVVAGLISPTAASRGAAAGRVFHLAECAPLSGGDDSDDDNAAAAQQGAASRQSGGGGGDDGIDSYLGLWPDPLMYVAVFCLPVPVAPSGEGGSHDAEGDQRTADIQRAAGAALATTALSVVVLGASLWTVRCLLHRQQAAATEDAIAKDHDRRRNESGWGKAVGALYALVLAFYGPNMTQLAVEVNVIGGGGVGVVPVAIAVFSMAVQVALLAPAVGVIGRAPPSAAIGGDDDDEARIRHAVYAFVSPLVSTARSTAERVIRVVALEDIAFAHCVAFIAGLRPRERPACAALIGTIAVLTLLHLAYLVIIKPYASRAELAFALIVAVGIVAQVVAALFVLYDRAQPVALSAVGVALDVVFFVQLGVLAGMEVWRAARRRWRSREGHSGRAEAEAPLLVIPPTASPPIPIQQHSTSAPDGRSWGVATPPPAEIVTTNPLLLGAEPTRKYR